MKLVHVVLEIVSRQTYKQADKHMDMPIAILLTTYCEWSNNEVFKTFTVIDLRTPLSRNALWRSALHQQVCLTIQTILHY